MRVLATFAALILIFLILLDAFETIVLPRRVARWVRLARLVTATWGIWSTVARWISGRSRRESYLSFFGPLSAIVLLAIWAAGLILSFAVLMWASGSPLALREGIRGFWAALYMSGTTFFPLGFGDASFHSGTIRIAVVVEAGLGIGFLALVISYLPVLYQAFSRREVRISMLDQWAGSPPTAAELLRRLGQDAYLPALGPLLQEWEQWSAELLETHISYPILAYFRSQHDNQSWLAALTTILDACALAIVGINDLPSRRASLTFAMARHAVVDLSQILDTPPRVPEVDRLPPADLARLRVMLAAANVHLRDGREADQKMTDLRRLYEPYVNSLARYLVIALPAWIPEPGAKDNWQKTKWK